MDGEKHINKSPFMFYGTGTFVCSLSGMRCMVFTFQSICIQKRKMGIFAEGIRAEAFGGFNVD